MTKKELIALIENIVAKEVTRQIGMMMKSKVEGKNAKLSRSNPNVKTYSANPFLNEILMNTAPISAGGAPSHYVDIDDDIPVSTKSPASPVIVPDNIEGRPLPMTEATKDVLSIINRDYSKIVEKMR